MNTINTKLEQEFKIKRIGKYNLAFYAECDLEELATCLKYIDKNDNFKTPFNLKVSDVNIQLGKDGFSGRVFIDHEKEKDWNMEMSYFHSPPQEFIELRVRICKYL
jgi:hypothetical protein